MANPVIRAADKDYHCPYCREPMRYFSHGQGKDMHPGVFAICTGCSGVSRYRESGVFTRVLRRERRALPVAEQQELLWFQEAVRRVHKDQARRAHLN